MDQLGSIRALTDGSGAVVRTADYDAYGQPTSTTGSTSTPFGYAGEYTDAETGFLYLRARYYDPATQQFLTVDPLLAATEQAYNYAGGNPTNATDPTGLCDQEHPVDCFQEMEAGGAGEVTTGKGVRIGPNGTSTYEEHWDYSSGEPISARTTSASSVAPPDFWKKFIDLLTGKVANGTTRVTSSELQDFTSGMQNGSCQLGYNGNRANFWKGTVRSVLDEAPKDSANLANCPGCSNPIGRGNIIRGGQSRRDFDIDHSDIIWANRTAQIPSSTSRSVVIELYNFALRALCPDCNQSHRMEP